MSVERLLQCVLYLLSIGSSILLGLGTGDVQQAVFLTLCAAAALFFADVRAWMRINRLFANIAMLVAAILTMRDFLQLDSENQLRAIGVLLTWVQMILMFQAKNVRVYGSLALFSLLQVVVASLLSVGLTFGILLMVYLLDAMLFLVLFSVYREMLVVTGPRRQVKPEVIAYGEGESTGAPWRRLLWHKPQVSDRGEVTLLDRQFGGTRLFGPALAMAAPVFLFALFFFYSAPRTSGRTWQTTPPGRAAMVGFSTDLRLGKMSDLLENSSPVCRITLNDAESNKPLEVLGGPYLNGSVLTRYTRGQWQPPNQGPGARLVRPPPSSRLVVQDVTLSPTYESTLFAIWPLYDVESTPRGIRIEEATRRIFRRIGLEDYGRPSPFRFITVTTALRDGGQVPVTPLVPNYDLAYNQFEQMRSFDERLDRLRQFTRDYLDQHLPPASDGPRTTTVVARTLENYLKTSADFRYTLRLSAIRTNAELDPVEDFLLNHRSGNCAYFASALTLMLRSQRLPARLIVGFRAQEFNDVGQYYLVRQRDAHAWVEVFLEPHEVDPQELPDGEAAPRGGWLRLDPTPATRGAELAGVERGAMDRFDEIFDYLQVLWNEHVVGLNRERQSQIVYDPLANRSGSSTRDSAWNAWFRGWESVPRRIWDAVRQRIGSWKFWLGAAIAASGAYWLGRRTAPWWRRILRRGRAAESVRPTRPPVEFYRRWEAALAQWGLRRTPSQTPREFAASIAPTLRQTAPEGTLDLWAERVVQAFYRVRFGNATLDKDEAESIEQAVCDLEREIRHEDRHRRVPRIG